MRTLLCFRARPVVSLAALAVLGAGVGACSSPSAPTEPVVYNLLAIYNRPLPTWQDATAVVVDRIGTVELWDLYVLSGTLTLFPDGTFRNEKRVVRRVNEVVVEDLGTPTWWGTYRWTGDSLFALREGPPIPPGGAFTGGCCTYPYKASADGLLLRGFESNGWSYAYERVSAVP